MSQTGWLWATETQVPTILEAGGPKSRWRHGWFPWRLGGAALPAPGSGPDVWGPWLVEASL